MFKVVRELWLQAYTLSHVGKTEGVRVVGKSECVGGGVILKLTGEPILRACLSSHKNARARMHVNKYK